MSSRKKKITWNYKRTIIEFLSGKYLDGFLKNVNALKVPCEIS